MNDTIRERLKKVYELVNHGGTEGEKAAAKAAIDRLLKRYNLDESVLKTIDLVLYTFKYSTILERKLLAQLMYLFIPDALKRSLRGRKEIVSRLTYTDWIMIDSSYEYFRRHMKVEWKKSGAIELARCRKTKTKNARRRELEPLFFNSYIIASKLYKEGDLETVPVSEMSQREKVDRYRFRDVEGGSYKKQVVTNLLLTN